MESEKSSSLAREIWLKASEYIRERVCDITYQQWFGNMQPLFIEDSTLTLGVSDEFFKQWAEQHYKDLIDEAVCKITNGKIKNSDFETGYFPANLPSACGEEVNICEEDKEEDKNVGEPAKLASLNPKYTFENFVVGEENRYAYAATRTASVDPGHTYNPLYIYGRTGLGKTHLIQGAGHAILNKHKNMIIEYITCENFLNLYVDAIKNKTHSEFRERFRNVDVLIVDDVHILANTTQLQEEFFNTFNSLYHENKQIILTSDRPPSEIKGLEDRLVSRFESGVTTEITPPGFETRLAILKKKQEAQLIKLNDEVLFLIASRIKSNIRRLEGALLKLVAYASIANEEITLEMAESILGNLLEEEYNYQKVSVDTIVKLVAEQFDIRVSDIMSHKRPKNIAVPRMVAMYLARQMTSHSFPELAEAFGRRNHATVLHAYRKIKKDLEKDVYLKKSVSAIQRKLQYS